MHLPRFTALLTLGFLAIGLSGCAYLIPENQNAPRYNQVIGERHRPQLNNSTAPQSSLDSSTAPQSALAAPVTPVAQNDMPPAPITVADNGNFPPVDEATKAAAARELAMNNPVPAEEVRRVPVENTSADAMQLAANYPDLTNVPPRPPMTGEGSSQGRLTNVRSALEDDRASAVKARGELARDAAAEPSMLGGVPETSGTVPAPAPVSVAPIAPPVAPAPGIIATPPNPVYAPPPTPQSLNLPSASMPVAQAPAAPAPVYVPPAPQIAYSPAPAAQIAYRSPAPEPIILRPPVADMPVAAMPPAPTFAPAPSPAKPAIQSGFDPMANATTAISPAPTFYASSGYLPASRYSR